MTDDIKTLDQYGTVDANSEQHVGWAVSVHNLYESVQVDFDGEACVTGSISVANARCSAVTDVPDDSWSAVSSTEQVISGSGALLWDNVMTHCKFLRVNLVPATQDAEDDYGSAHVLRNTKH